MSLNKPTHTAVATTLAAVTQYLGYQPGKLRTKNVVCRATDLGPSTVAKVAMVVTSGQREVALVGAKVTVLWNKDHLGVPSHIEVELTDQSNRERFFEFSISRDGKFRALSGSASSD